MPPIQQTEQQRQAAFQAAGVPLPPTQAAPVVPQSTTSAPVVPTGTGAVPIQPAQYVVKPGDTVDAIAKRYGVPRANVQGFRSNDPNTILPDEVLTISQPTIAPQQPLQAPQKPVQSTQTTTQPQKPTATFTTPSGAKVTETGEMVSPPEQKFFGQFGVSTDALEQGFTQNPFATISALVQQVMSSTGLPDVKKNITDISKEIEDLANERDDEIAKAQDNPFASAGTKSARVKQIEDRYEKKIANRVNRLTLMQNAYQDARQQSQFAATMAVGLYDKERAIEADQIEKALDRAEKKAEAERKLQELDYSIQDVGGRTVRFGFDKAGNVASRTDIGAAKAPGAPTPPGELTAKQTSVAIQLANSLKSHPAYTDMQDIATGMSGVQTGLSQKNGFGDITAINAFQRMVDPGATVREGDVALIQTASAFLSKVLSDYPIEKLQKGSKLPDATREQMLKTASELYERRSKNYNDTVGNQYRNLSGGSGIPFEYIGQDFPTQASPQVTPTQELNAMMQDAATVPDIEQDTGGWFDNFLGVFGLKTK